MDTRSGPAASSGADAQQSHDPYARRPGYVTGVDGRTDTWTTAVVAGVVTGVAVLFVAGLLQLAAVIAWPAAIVVGAAVWLALRARRRAADRRAGRSPDEVAEARSRAVADTNGGRRFLVAQNPVVVIVMAVVFLVLAVVRLIAVGPSVGPVVIAVVVAVSGVFFLVQGIGTLVARRRERTGGSEEH